MPRLTWPLSNARLGRKERKGKNPKNGRTEAATPTLLLALVRKSVLRGKGTGDKSPFLKQRSVWWLEKKVNSEWF